MANATRTIRNKPSHSGHESVLSAFQKNEKHVTLLLVGGGKAEGKIKSFDRFTISLVSEGQEYPVIYFKSAIVGFFSADI